MFNDSVGRGPGRSASFVVVAPDDRDEPIVEIVDASQGGVENLDRTDLPGPDGGRHLAGSGIAIVIAHNPELTEAA